MGAWNSVNKPYINSITPVFKYGKHVFQKVGEQKVYQTMHNNKAMNDKVQIAYKTLLEKIETETALDNAKLTQFVDDFKSVLKTEYKVS